MGGCQELFDFHIYTCYLHQFSKQAKYAENRTILFAIIVLPSTVALLVPYLILFFSVLKVYPTLATVKMAPRIILAIPSQYIAIQGLYIQRPDTPLLTLKIVTLLPMQNLIRAPGRVANSLEPDAILVANVPCVGVGV